MSDETVTFSATIAGVLLREAMIKTLTRVRSQGGLYAARRLKPIGHRTQ